MDVKIPEFQLKWAHVALAVFLSVVIVLNILLFVEFRTNSFRGQVTQNSNNIQAIVQVLQQNGIIQAPVQQPTPAEKSVPEKK